MKVTPVDYIILALLRQESQTGYRIRKAFEMTALGNFSSSPGSIYPAIHKLSKLAYLASEPSSQGRSPALKITETGQDVLRAWFEQPISRRDVTHNVHILILRFAFMPEDASVAGKIQFIQSFIEEVSTYLDELRAFHAREGSGMALTGRMAFENGLEIYQPI